MQVFLCHSSEDKSAIRRLRDELKSLGGIEPWFDEDQLTPGQDWAFEIHRAVASSHVIIVCLSRTSVTKEGFVQKEIRTSLDVAEEKPEGTIFIIPLRLEECNMPHKLKHLQWVDWFCAEGPKKLRDSLKARANQLGMDIGCELHIKLPSWMGDWINQISALEDDIRSGNADRRKVRDALKKLLRIAHETQSEALLTKHYQLKHLFHTMDPDD